MPDRDSPFDIIRELEEKIRVLQIENSHLAERAEDTLLLGIVAEHISSADDVEQMLDVSLERVSILKNIPFCACCTVTENRAVINRFYLSFGTENLQGREIVLPPEIVRQLASDSCLLSVEECRSQGITIPCESGRFVLLSALLIPFRSRFSGANLFIFADNMPDNGLSNASVLLHRIVEVIASRLENISLLQELRKMNAALDRKVEERTRDLNDANRRLKAETAGHKQTAEELRSSEEYLRLAVTSSGVGLWKWDIATNNLKWNDRLKEIFGLAPDTADLTLEKFLASIYPDDLGGTEESFRAALSKRLEFHHEYRIVRPDESVHWIEAIGRGSYDEAGHPLRMMGGALDITERKKLEDQLRQAQKMEAVGHLAGGIAHDFNNILTAIMGYSHLMLAKMDEHPLRIYLKEILSSAEKAANLTHSLLAFSRKQILNPKPVDLNEILTGMQKILRRIIGEDIVFQVNTLPQAVIIKADRSQIEQALMNLVTNARDAMPGGGTLTISTDISEIDEKFIRLYQYGHAGSYAVLSVSDTGVGMDETTKQSIFEPFFSTKETGKGTGLGLSMVYGTISQHNGFIHVYSEPGAGSRFTLYLPLEKSLHPVTDTQETDSFPSGNETILLVEDDEAVRTVTKALLEELGYFVLEAGNGEEALRLFRGNMHTIELVISDIIMPGQSGKSLRDELRIIQPEVKVLFISGYTADMLTHKGLLDDDVNFLPKPLRPDSLSKKVREMLGR